MPCSHLICGLTRFSIVLGNIRQISPDKVCLTTDKLQDGEGLELRIAKDLEIKKKDYGLAIVSCKKVVPEYHQRNADGISKLKVDDIDLSRLELVDFFSFMALMTSRNRRVRLSPEIVLTAYNSLFEEFVKKPDIDKKKDLLDPYKEEYKGLSKTPKKHKRYPRGEASAPMAL